jgi:hypothetical protein
MGFKKEVCDRLNMAQENLRAVEAVIGFVASKLDIDIIGVRAEDTGRLIKATQEGYIKITDNGDLIVLAKELKKKK